MPYAWQSLMPKSRLFERAWLHLCHRNGRAVVGRVVGLAVGWLPKHFRMPPPQYLGCHPWVSHFLLAGKIWGFQQPNMNFKKKQAFFLGGEAPTLKKTVVPRNVVRLHRAESRWLATPKSWLVYWAMINQYMGVGLSTFQVVRRIRWRNPQVVTTMPWSFKVLFGISDWGRGWLEDGSTCPHTPLSRLTAGTCPHGGGWFRSFSFLFMGYS